MRNYITGQALYCAPVTDNSADALTVTACKWNSGGGGLRCGYAHSRKAGSLSSKVFQCHEVSGDGSDFSEPRSKFPWLRTCVFDSPHSGSLALIFDPKGIEGGKCPPSKKNKTKKKTQNKNWLCHGNSLKLSYFKHNAIIKVTG